MVDCQRAARWCCSLRFFFLAVRLFACRRGHSSAMKGLQEYSSAASGSTTPFRPFRFCQALNQRNFPHSWPTAIPAASMSRSGRPCTMRSSPLGCATSRRKRRRPRSKPQEYPESAWTIGSRWSATAEAHGGIQAADEAIRRRSLSGFLCSAFRATGSWRVLSGRPRMSSTTSDGP